MGTCSRTTSSSGRPPLPKGEGAEHPTAVNAAPAVAAATPETAAADVAARPFPDADASDEPGCFRFFLAGAAAAALVPHALPVPPLTAAAAGAAAAPPWLRAGEALPLYTYTRRLAYNEGERALGDRGTERLGRATALSPWYGTSPPPSPPSPPSPSWRLYARGYARHHAKPPKHRAAPHCPVPSLSFPFPIATPPHTCSSPSRRGCAPHRGRSTHTSAPRCPAGPLGMRGK